MQRDGIPYLVTPGQPDHGIVLVLRRHPGAQQHLGTRGADDQPLVTLGPLEQGERNVIVEILDECHGIGPEAAQRLGISRGTLYQRLHRYRIG